MGQQLLIMGALKMEVQSLMHALFAVYCVMHVLGFEVDHLFSGQSVL